jgi:hypothetical protein
MLTGFAARYFPFNGRRVLKVTAVYLLTLAVGIGVAMTDELIHPHPKASKSEGVAPRLGLQRNVSSEPT